MGIRDIIVGQEDHTHVISDFLVVVDGLSQTVDKFDDPLGGEVSGSSLASDHRGSWNELLSILRLRLLDHQVSMRNVERVHQLPLVLMDSLNHHIEQRVFIHGDPALLSDPSCQTFLVLKLDGHELLDELLVVDVLHQIPHFVHVMEPILVAKVFGV